MQFEYLLANRLPRLAEKFIKLSEIVKKPNPESEAAKTTLYQKAAKLSRADTGRKRKLEAAKASASINPVVRHHHCGETSPLSRFSAQSQGIYAIQSNFSACWTHERWPTHETWRQFREWYRQNQADFLPAVEGIIPWQWSQHFMFKQRTDRMWDMWYIRFADENNLYTVGAGRVSDVCVQLDGGGARLQRAGGGGLSPVSGQRGALPPAIPSAVCGVERLVQ